jgi:hypothetical protein
MSQIVYYCREVKFDVSSCVVKNLHINEPEKKCQIAYLLDMTFNLTALTRAFELSQTTNIAYKKLDMQKGKPRTGTVKLN